MADPHSSDPHSSDPGSSDTGSSDTGSQQELLRARYGAPSPRRRRALVIATTVLAVAFGLWLAWAAWFHSDPPIRAELIRFDVTGEHEVRIQIDLALRESGISGVCAVRALAEDHTPVGEHNLTTAELAEAEGTWIPLRTERRASAVEVVRCAEDAAP